MGPENPFKKAILSRSFSFSARPEPIAGDLRMSWGIGVLLLSLLYSRGRKASFQKLQFLAHAVRLPEGREEVRDLFSGNLQTSDISVRVEPWLKRAVAYAHALKLVSVTKGKQVVLSVGGRNTAIELESSKDILLDEKEFLKEIAPRLTDVLINKIWRMETIA